MFVYVRALNLPLQKIVVPSTSLRVLVIYLCFPNRFGLTHSFTVVIHYLNFRLFQSYYENTYLIRCSDYYSFMFEVGRIELKTKKISKTSYILLRNVQRVNFFTIRRNKTVLILNVFKF